MKITAENYLAIVTGNDSNRVFYKAEAFSVTECLPVSVTQFAEGESLQRIGKLDDIMDEFYSYYSTRQEATQECRKLTVNHILKQNTSLFIDCPIYIS